MSAVAAPDLPPGGIGWDETLDLTASDGIRLRGALWRGSGRGMVLLLPGRTEFLEKSATVATELVGLGFAVASADWRGQGRSQRLLEPHLKGHVADFTDYALDLDALLAHPAVAGTAGPRIILGHSMGGTIALGALHRKQITVSAALLSAPMLGIVTAAWARLTRPLILAAARRSGRLDSWPPVVRTDQPYVFSGFEGNVLTSDRMFFEWMEGAIRRAPELQLAMPTLGWLDTAYREMKWLRRQGPLACPSLWLIGSREQVVDALAVRRAAARMGGKLAEIAGARHELLVESEPMRGNTWAAIDRFLAERGL